MPITRDQLERAVAARVAHMTRDELSDLRHAVLMLKLARSNDVKGRERYVREIAKVIAGVPLPEPEMTVNGR